MAHRCRYPRSLQTFSGGRKPSPKFLDTTTELRIYWAFDRRLHAYIDNRFVMGIAKAACGVGSPVRGPLVQSLDKFLQNQRDRAKMFQTIGASHVL
jgi:hypothetical protein